MGLPARGADSARGTPARWKTRAGDPAAGKAPAARTRPLSTRVVAIPATTIASCTAIANPSSTDHAERTRVDESLQSLSGFALIRRAPTAPRSGRPTGESTQREFWPLCLRAFVCREHVKSRATREVTRRTDAGHYGYYFLSNQRVSWTTMRPSLSNRRMLDVIERPSSAIRRTMIPFNVPSLRMAILNRVRGSSLRS